MNGKITDQIELLNKKGFIINDEDQEKVLGYLEKVGYHKLSPYFRNANNDINKVISYYIFDKRLRFLILDMLEVIENAIKSVFINYVGESFGDKSWYLDRGLYNEEFVAERLGFIGNKIAEWKINDQVVKNYFKWHAGIDVIPDYIFFDKLTFGELTKVYRDLKNEHKKTIAGYFGINGMLFEDWMVSLKYLRNLCSHYENVFNKKMIFSIRSKLIAESIGNQNTFLAYFALLSIFNKLLIPNFEWYKKVIELLNKFCITSEQIGLETKNLPSELESEAWEVLVNSLYGKYIIKSNLFEEQDHYQTV